MSEHPVIALRVRPGQPTASERAGLDRRWRARHLLLATALLWAGVMGVWAVRLGNWYGRLRADAWPG